MIGDLAARLPRHILHPACRPEPLQRHECRLGQHGERGDPPEFTAPPDLPEPLELLPERAPGPPVRAAPAPAKDQRARRGEGEAKQGKQHAPVDPLQCPFHRRGGKDGADPSRREDPSVEAGEPMAGKPECVRLEPGHQAGADPQADEPPSDDQKERAVAPGEQHRSRRRDQQQRAFDAARPETVEQHAEQGLKKREGEEIDAGEEPKIGGVKMERPHQIGRDDGIDVPEQIGEEIAAGKGSDDREEQAASLRWNGSRVCADTGHTVSGFRWRQSGRNRALPVTKFHGNSLNRFFRGACECTHMLPVSVDHHWRVCLITALRGKPREICSRTDSTPRVY